MTFKNQDYLNMKQEYDVVIAGGGLAGLTLSIQLKQANPDISILILESRDKAAAIAAHKVGESTVELATHYFREVLGLKNYLEEYNDINIALDTYPYVGGGTTCEALYMGTPVITLVGDRHGSRFGYSILKNALI